MTEKPVAFHDKDQPNGIAWCPGYPQALKDMLPLYAVAKASTSAQPAMLTVQFTPEEIADLLWNLSAASDADWPSYTAYQKLAAAQNLAATEMK